MIDGYDEEKFEDSYGDESFSEGEEAEERNETIETKNEESKTEVEDVREIDDVVKNITHQPLEVRFRGILLQAAKLQHELTEKRIEGASGTATFAREIFKLIKLRIRTIGIQRLLYGMNHPYRVFALVDLVEAYVSAGVWQTALEKYADATALFELLQDEVLPSTRLESSADGVSPVVRALRESVESSTEAISLERIRRKLRHEFESHDYASCFEGEGTVDIVEAVRILRRSSSSFASRAERAEHILTPFRAAILRRAFDDAGGETDTFVSRDVLFATCKSSLDVRCVAELNEMERDLRHDSVCWEEMLESAAKTQTTSAWDVTRVRMYASRAIASLRIGNLTDSRDALKFATAQLRKTKCQVHAIALPVYACMSRLAYVDRRVDAIKKRRAEKERHRDPYDRFRRKRRRPLTDIVREMTNSIQSHDGRRFDVRLWDTELHARTALQQRVSYDGGGDDDGGDETNMAIRWADRALQIAICTFGNDHSLTLALMADLCALHTIANRSHERWSEVVTTLENNLEARCDDVTRTCAFAHEVLASLLVRRRHFRKAASHLEAAAKIYEAVDDTDRSTAIRQVEASLLANRVSGQARAAARALQANCETIRRIDGEHSLRYAQCLKDEGVMWGRADEKLRALRALRVACKIFEGHHGDRDSSVRKIRSLIARAQRAGGGRS